MKRVAFFSAEAIFPKSSIYDALEAGELITPGFKSKLQLALDDKGGHDKREDTQFPEAITPRMKIMAEALMGKSIEEVVNVVAKVFADAKYRYGYVKPLINDLHEEEPSRAVLFTDLPDAVAQGQALALGMNHGRGTTLGIKNGIIDGTILFPFGPTMKSAMSQIIYGPLGAYADRVPEPFVYPDEVYAFGHGMEDVAMLEKASEFDVVGRQIACVQRSAPVLGRIGTAVCIDPTPGLRGRAQENWVVIDDASQPLSLSST